MIEDQKKIKTNRKIIEQLKSYVALQLQAYYQSDWELYDALEEKIRRIENKIII